MSTRIYTLPVEQTGWQVPSGGAVTFSWDYDEGRDRLLKLYEKGKREQWNANERLDWSHEVDLDDPLQSPPEFNPLFGTEIWNKLDQAGKNEVRLHTVAWQFSQFLHGEQGALICASRIVETVPDIDAKFYAATQVMDEARHVEVYSRYLQEKLGLAYPIHPHLRILLDQVIRDSRWDFTYLGMQILIEGLALAAFGMIRDFTTDPLATSLNSFVMQDEARHVAFGVLALRDYYPQLTEAERQEREEFCVEACYRMRDRFLGEEVWQRLELGAEAAEHVRNSEPMREFQKVLFTRIVPALRTIGLWGPTIRRAFEDIGVIGFGDIALEHVHEADDARARAFDAARENLREAIELGKKG